MIKVTITSKGGKHELGRIHIENVSTSADGRYGDYSLQFGVDTGAGVAVIQRSVYAFPRKDLNVLALVRLALETLEEKELSLDADPDARRSPNLARGLPRSLWPF